MKSIILRLTAFFLVFVFLSHVTGIRISEHNCFDCGTSHLEIGGHLHTLHLILSVNSDHDCCDPFHHQHEDHSKSCSHKFLGYSVPFKSMESSKIQHFTPSTDLTQDLTLFHGTYEKCYSNPTIIGHPATDNILLKTCQFLT